MPASGLAQDPTPAKLWQELDQALPRKGQTGSINSPSAAIDWPDQVSKAEQVLVRSGATPVEPFAMYYLGCFLFEAGRLDEATALFETVKSQFPTHPLVTMAPAKDQKPLVMKGLDDCAAEMGWRTKHPRKPMVAPVLNPKLTAVLKLSTGDVKVRFYDNVAPHHVENFVKHAEAGDYDGTKITQVIQESVVNLGDPASKLAPTNPPTPPNPAAAGPAQPHEFANLSHVRGALAMARHPTGMDSSTMPFQVILKDQPYFDFTQTIFGKVIDGIEIVDAISRMPRDQYQKPATDVILNGVTIIRE
jgi:cyclophilin family peptidyl-prolyl cis-trans isomerase